MGLIAGAFFLIGNFVSISIYGQNSTASAPDVYSKSLEMWIGLVIAVAALGKTFADKFHLDGKVGKVFTIVGEQGNEILKNKDTIREGMTTVYEMLPEESKQIVNRPLVRVQELNKDVENYTGKVKVINNVVDKYGKPVPT